MKKLMVCIKQVEKAYTGSFRKHDEITCTTCKANQPCQYQVEDEWVKLGYLPIKQGEQFQEYESIGDSIRLIGYTQFYGTRFTVDISPETFDECFEIPRFRIGFFGNNFLRFTPRNTAAELFKKSWL